MGRTINKELFASKRNHILDTFYQLILQQGYEHTSIQDIITSCNISKGAFYHYFHSKQETLDALVLYITVQITTNLPQLSTKKATR